MHALKEFLTQSLTPYHACQNACNFLEENGFMRLNENEDWEISQGGKYFVTRGDSSVIAFRVGGLDNFSYNLACAHLDSPALKLKQNPVENKGDLATLNVETYGGGLWYTFLDRPLRIAGRVVKSENNRVFTKLVQAPFLVTVPSLAIHKQVDLQPLLGYGEQINEWLLEQAGGNVLSYDLYAVNADTPYTFGVNDAFLASPRVDNLVGAFACLNAVCDGADSDGVSVCALFHSEEIGNRTAQGADGNFLDATLRRIAYLLRFDDGEYYKALASSFLLSVDNAHALHPNHPETSDSTNKATLGGGVTVKTHAGGAYITDGLSAGVVKTLFQRAGVKYPDFFNRSDAKSGATLGASVATRLGVLGADIGVAQLAMHSACECFAVADYEELKNGLTAFYSSKIIRKEDGFILQ